MTNATVDHLCTIEKYVTIYKENGVVAVAEADEGVRAAPVCCCCCVAVVESVQCMMLVHCTNLCTLYKTETPVSDVQVVR